MKLSNVVSGDFQRDVLESEIPVLVAFRAAWCSASLELEPIVEELATTYEGRARVMVLDVGDGAVTDNRVAQRYKVTRLPVIMLFDEGRAKDHIGGLASRDTIAAMIEHHVGPVLEVGSHDFDAEVLRAPLPVLVHFHAAGCRPSIELLPIVEDAARRLRGRVKVVRLESTESNAPLRARYGALRLPVLAAFEGGELKDALLGAISSSAQRRVRTDAVLKSVEGMMGPLLM